MIGDKIRDIRKSKNLTQKALGEKIGVHESTIRSYETGRNKPNSEMIVKLAEALEVNEKEFFEETHKSMTAQIVDRLVEEGLISETNIDKNYIDMLISAIKADIKISKQK